MVEKRILKRLIALLLGICMICTTCFHAVNVKATDSETQFTELTLSDLGISSGSYNAGASGTYADGFENTIVSFYATSTTVAGPPRIHFGSWGQTDRTGINVLFYGEVLVVGNDGFDGDETKKLDYTRNEVLASDFGLTSFVDAKILYQLKTEYLALDADGTKNDIRFILYVNQQEAISVDIKDQVDKLGEYVYFCDGIHVLEDYTDVKLKDVRLNESPEANYEKLTLSDFEIADGSLNTIGETTVNLGSTLDKTLFQAKMYFPKTDFGSFFLGGADWNGISVKTYGDGNLYMYVISTTGTYELVIDPVKVETNLFENDNLQFAISTQFVELDETTGTTKLKIGVWFDGVLYNNEYFMTEEVAVEDLTRHIHGKSIAATLKGYSISSEEVQKELASSEEANYEKFTFSDFGIADGSLNTVGETTVNYGSTLDKTLLHAKLNIPKDAFGNLIWGGEGWNGYNITGGEETLHLTVVWSTGSNDFLIEKEKTESQLFENDELEFAISTEFVEPDTVAGTTKLKIGVWLDGILYDNEYFMTDTVVIADFARHLHGKNVSANMKGYSISSEEVQKELASSEEANYEKFTFSDFGVADGSLNTVGETTVNYGSTLDKTLLQAKLNIPKDVFGNLIWGGEGWNGYNITGGEETLHLTVVWSTGSNDFLIEKEKTESQLFENDELEFAISTEFVEPDTVAGTTKLKIGVWLDGILYNNEYFMTDTVVIADFERHLHGKNVSANMRGYSISSEEVQKELASSEEANYQKYTFSDFEIGDGSLNLLGETTINHGLSLDKTLFQAKMYFPKTDFGSFFWGGEGWNGISIKTYGDERLFLYVTSGVNTYEFVINPALVETHLFENENLELSISTEFIEADETAGTTKLKIGVWLDGLLYNNAYFMTEEVTIADMIKHIHGKMLTAEFKGYSVKSAGSEPEDEVIVQGTYEKMTMRDYLLEKLTHVSGNISRTYDNQSLNGTSFGATFHFSKDNNGTTAFYLGAKEWYGIRLEVQPDGNLGVSHIGTDGRQKWIAIVAPEEVGMKTFLGEKFKLLMTFDTYGEKEDRINCRIGLYINDKLYKDEHLTLKNVEKDTLTRSIFIYSGGHGSVSIESIYKKVDFTIWGLNDNWKQTLGIS